MLQSVLLKCLKWHHIHHNMILLIAVETTGSLFSTQLRARFYDQMIRKVEHAKRNLFTYFGER